MDKLIAGLDDGSWFCREKEDWRLFRAVMSALVVGSAFILGECTSYLSYILYSDITYTP